jgi:hypothetical protein
VLEGLCREFADVEPAAAEADLRKALDELLALGLVVDARTLEVESANA